MSCKQILCRLAALRLHYSWIGAPQHDTLHGILGMHHVLP
jgi:hypothetical protein